MPVDETGVLGQTESEVTDNAVYTVRGVHSQRCLDVANGSTSDSAAIQLWDCNGTTAQQFRFEPSSGRYRIRNIASNKCLTMNSTSDGARTTQASCGSGSVVRLVSQPSGKALDAWGWGTTNGTQVNLWPITGGDNQHWTLARQSSTSTGTGGSSGTSGGTSGGTTGGTGTVGSTGCSSVGSTTTVSTTIRVNGGVYDGQCRRFRAGGALGDGSQSESQQPIFRLENGATLRNVVLGAPAADGVHTYGNATLENITWEDVGEDAMTIKSGGTVTLNGGSARAASDKIFQINAASTFRISNFRATDAGKMIRQNGGTTYAVNVFIDRCDISNMDEAIFRTDSSSSRVTMTNTRYSDIGDALFIGVSSGNITLSNNTEY
jgi:hypothetical protein